MKTYNEFINEKTKNVTKLKGGDKFRYGHEDYKVISYVKNNGNIVDVLTDKGNLSFKATYDVKMIKE